MLTLSKLKRFLEIPEERTEKDDLLAEFIEDSIGEANRVSGRVLEFSDHTVYIDGTGTNVIELGDAPVYNVTELKYWNGEDYTDLLEAGDTIEDVVIYPGGFKIKLKNSYLFYKGILNVMVSYSAGYKWADEWQTETEYLEGNIVIYNNQLYTCSVAHTSSSIFEPGNWQSESAETVPADLEKALKYNAAVLFYESPAGKNLLGRTSENIGGASSKGTSYDFEVMREYYTKTYESYRKINV